MVRVIFGGGLITNGEMKPDVLGTGPGTSATGRTGALGLWTSKKKSMVLYSAVSSPLDRSKRFTLSSPGRPVHSDTVLGFSWKHSSHVAIAQRLFTHISTTVYSQVLIYTAESTEAL